MPYWAYADCLSCSPPTSGLSYSGAFLRTTDGAQGSLGAKSGEWTAATRATMVFPAETPPYAIGGYSDPSTGVIEQGFPGPLTAGGTAFLTGCFQVVNSNPQDDIFCP
jgi:hypothetical protein